jgi:peptide/nickel transport system permease protein
MGAEIQSRRAATSVLIAGQEERAQLRKSQSNYARAWRRFRGNKMALAALTVALLLVLMALCAPLISKYITHVSPSKQSLLHQFEPVSRSHWFGTDELGRDVLTRIAYGARVSLGVAFTAVLAAIFLGTLVGSSAGYYGRWVETVLMRFVDVMLSIPSIILLILISALFHVGPVQLALVIAALGWFGLARLLRSEILSIKRREYVEAARVIGAPDRVIIRRHVLPNVTHLIIVFATGATPAFILTEAALSYLGLGIQPPTPSWGNMLTNAQQYIYKSKGLVFIPGFFISITVLSLIVVGYALRDALDPRLSK